MRYKSDKKIVIDSCIYLLCIFQFLALFYSPFAQIPSQEDLEAGNESLNIISQIQGDVFIPNHGYLSTLAGKRSHAQTMAVADVLRGNDSIKKNILIDRIRQAIKEKRFNAIIFDSKRMYSVEEIEMNYIMQTVIFNSSTVFWPVTGHITRPEFIYVPIRNETTG